MENNNQKNKDSEKEIEKEKEIFNACENWNLQLLEQFINQKGNVNVVSKETGITLLQSSITHGFTAGVKALVLAGALQITFDKSGRAPIHVAILNGDVESATLLLPKGMYYADKSGKSCLRYAIDSGSSEMFKLVSNKYAPLPGVSNRDTELLYAARANKLVIEVLGCDKFETVVDQLNQAGCGAIHYVTLHKNLPFLNKLIECNVNVNLYTMNGETPVMIASRKGWEEGLQQLLAAGANVFCRDRNGDTPLHVAAKNNRKTILDILAEEKAFETMKHVKNKEGKTYSQILENDQVTGEESSGKIGLQLISDVHVEFGGTHNIVRAAPYLILAGDIGVACKPGYKNFLLEMANIFDKVFVVAGNHEYYGSTIENTMETISQICSEHPNLVFLNRTRYMLDEKTRLIGTVLWSDIPSDYANTIQYSINDYFKITTTHLMNFDYTKTKEDKGVLPTVFDRKITPADSHHWHQLDKAWILQEIQDAKVKGEKVVIVTHHAPVMDCSNSDGEYEVMEMKHAFSSPLTALLGDPVVAWLFGHTHWFYDITINGTRVVNNPEGYPSERIPYDGGFVVEV